MNKQTYEVTITSGISYLSDKIYWIKPNVTFDEFKQSLLRHFGNFQGNRKANKEKPYLKREIHNAQTIDDIYRSFNSTNFNIVIKHW